MSIIGISAAVGINAANRQDDVAKVQTMLNHFIGNRKLQGAKSLVIDGKCGPKTREAIMMLQIQNGLVSDEHFNGQIRPGGMTISFMNKHAGHVPPAPKAAGGAAGMSKQDKLDQVIAELDELRRTGKIDKLEYDAACAVAKSLSTTGDFVTYANLAMDLADLVVALPTHTAVGVSAFGYAAGAVQIAGPFLQFIGFVILLGEAMETDIRIYRSVGTAYGVTAWAFDEPAPRSSALVRTRIISNNFYGAPREGSVLDQAWLDVQKDLKIKLQTLTGKLKSDGSRKVLKAALSAGGKQNLAKALVLQIAAELPAKRHNETQALRNIARDLRYPN